MAANISIHETSPLFHAVRKNTYIYEWMTGRPRSTRTTSPRSGVPLNNECRPHLLSSEDSRASSADSALSEVGQDVNDLGTLL